MSLFERLSKNKGTVSSALGKTLAQQVLGQNQIDVLMECIDLASYQAPNSAAKKFVPARPKWWKLSPSSGRNWWRRI